MDLAQPVAVLMAAVLHFVLEGDQAAASIQAFHDAVAPGSYQVLSHGTADGQQNSAK